MDGDPGQGDGIALARVTVHVSGIFDICDFVDSHIPMFENMYGKWLNAYKQIGHEVCTGVPEKSSKRTLYTTWTPTKAFICVTLSKRRKRPSFPAKR